MWRSGSVGTTRATTQLLLRALTEEAPRRFWRYRELQHLREGGIQSCDVSITTDHVVVETLNLLTVRKEPHRARELSRSLFAEVPARLHNATDADMRRVREIFERFTDKEWSFTDCLSYAVIERLGIKKDLAFDDHFRQFGIVEVIP